MNFTRLPSTIAGFERVNDRVVDFEHTVQLREHKYRLRSIVCVEINKDAAANNGPKLVTGCSSLLVKYGETVGTPRYYWYNPRDAAIGHQRPDGSFEKNTPITVLDNTGVFAEEGNETFYEKGSKRGTVFVYEQEHDAGVNHIMAF